MDRDRELRAPFSNLVDRPGQSCTSAPRTHTSPLGRRRLDSFECLEQALGDPGMFFVDFFAHDHGVHDRENLGALEIVGFDFAKIRNQALDFRGGGARTATAYAPRSWRRSHRVRAYRDRASCRRQSPGYRCWAATCVEPCPGGRDSSSPPVNHFIFPGATSYSCCKIAARPSGHSDLIFGNADVVLPARSAGFLMPESVLM